MGRRWITSGIITLLSVLAVGCDNKVMDENRDLHRQNVELQAQLDEARRAREAQAPAPVVVAPATAPVPVPVPLSPPTAKPDLGSLVVTEDRAAGTTTVTLPGDVFFDSGRDVIKDSAKGSLDKVVAASESNTLARPFASRATRYRSHRGPPPLEEQSGTVGCASSGGKRLSDRTRHRWFPHHQQGLRRFQTQSHQGAVPPRRGGCHHRMISIVDYGMANLRSVQKGFEQVGIDARLFPGRSRLTRPRESCCPVSARFRMPSPPCGARLDVPILTHIKKGKPFLGICLGLQMLFDVGYEDGEHRGLGVLRGKCVRFNVDQTLHLKVPHMGCNTRSPSVLRLCAIYRLAAASTSFTATTSFPTTRR